MNGRLAPPSIGLEVRAPSMETVEQVPTASAIFAYEITKTHSISIKQRYIGSKLRVDLA